MKNQEISIRIADAIARFVTEFNVHPNRIYLTHKDYESLFEEYLRNFTGEIPYEVRLWKFCDLEIRNADESSIGLIMEL